MAAASAAGGTATISYKPVAAALAAVFQAAIFLNLDKPSSGLDEGYRLKQLPQVRIDGGKYFITWRLNDQHDKLSPAERSIVADELLRFHELRYRLSIFVVMDDHVHVLAQTLSGCDPGPILQRWKGATSRAINLLRQASGTRWQKASRTDLLRNESAVRSRREYIYENPRRRWDIAPEDYTWLVWFE